MGSRCPSDPGQKERGQLDEFTRWIWGRIRHDVGDRVLEVGCGRAGLVTCMMEGERRYLGVETDDRLVRENRRRHRHHENVGFLRANLFEGEIPDIVADMKPDTIICLNLLEHLERDREALRVFHDLLLPGGRIILQVPAHPGLYGSLDRRVGHRRRYRPPGLRERLRGPGFEDVRVEYFNRAGIVPWWVNGKLLRRSGGYFENQSERALRWHNRLIRLLRVVEPFVPLPIGLSLLGFGVKGSETGSIEATRE